jgi:hypothetical protein
MLSKKNFAFFLIFFYAHRMPNSRSDKAKGVIVMFRADFLDKIDDAMERMGYSDRSSLIRDAVYKLLLQHSVPVEPVDKTIPGRKGVGGRPKKVAPPAKPKRQAG